MKAKIIIVGAFVLAALAIVLLMGGGDKDKKSAGTTQGSAGATQPKQIGRAHV